MNRLSFNENWMFSKEGSNGAVMVTLPHDAMLFERRVPKAASTGACACFESGIYHYTKRFLAEKAWKDGTVKLYFEGSYRNTTVYLNGEKIGFCAYGYTAFTVDLDPGLIFDQENILEVVVDNSQLPNSRWYSGAGIYRPVWLILGAKKHICWQGVQISTESIAPAVIRVQTQHTGGAVSVEIRKDGNVVAAASGDDCTITVPQAQLWSAETPNLYTCRVSLWDGESKVDEAEETFGIRQITWSNKGLFINGKETLLRGGCVHHDNGILGAKTYAKTEWRRVKKLKDMGYNAIRSSHNPCSEEMLKACDYYGMYMMDELWDMWFNRKNRCDYAVDFMDHYEFDIRSMVAKDYNHPSVILYSIANEVSEPASEKGITMTKTLVAKLHELDTTRPVTAGFNLMIMLMAQKGKAIYSDEGGLSSEGTAMPNSSMVFNILMTMINKSMSKMPGTKKADEVTTPALDALDIAGYNYATCRYPKEGELHPDRVIFGSETFVMDLGKNWEMVKKYPYVIGDFMWTAWDYLGEAGAGAWGYTSDAIGFEKPYPWILADMGALDILGNPNGEAFYTSAVWGKLSGPRIAVRPVNKSGLPVKSNWRGTNSLPSWSWEDCDGKKAVVEVFTDAETVELFLNGKRIGKKKVKDYRATFKTKYAPGTLTAIAYDTAGKEVGRDELISATGKKSVTVTPEEVDVKAGDILYFDVAVVGENGQVEFNHDLKLTASVENGELLGFGSANPRTEESYVSGSYTTYYGRAQAVVRAGQSGVVTLRIDDGQKTTDTHVSIVH